MTADEDHCVARRRLLVIAGKGGVGRSTVAAAVGVGAARRGLRTVVVEVAGRGDVARALGREPTDGLSEREIYPGLSHGVGFDTEPDGSLALALEGGHTARRIVHAGGSATGRALTDRLIELVEASPAMDVRERTSGWRCGATASAAPR